MKLFICASVLFILSFTNVQAQFTGYYSLRDGGADAQSSTLFVLPDHTFMLFFIGGNPLQGKWVEESNNKIKLETITEDKSIFSVYAMDGNDTEKNIQFSPLEEVNLYVSFSKEGLRESQYQPLFDKNWGCLDRNFETKSPDKNGQLKLVSPDIGAGFSEEVKYPVTSNVYTFQLSDKFSNYRIFIDTNVKRPFKIEIEKHDQEYTIQEINGHNPRATERKDLTEKMLAKIKEGLIPWQINDLMRKGVKIEILHPIKVEKVELNKPIEKPLFIAKCE